MGLGEEHLGKDLPTAHVQASAQVDLELVTKSIELMLGLLGVTPNRALHMTEVLRRDHETRLQLRVSQAQLLVHRLQSLEGEEAGTAALCRQKLQLCSGRKAAVASSL